MNILADDYPLTSASFAPKTTDKLRRTRRAIAAPCVQSSCAVLVSVVRSFCLGSPAIARQCADVFAQGGAAIRARCAYSSGPVERWNVTRLSFEWRGAVLRTDPPASPYTSVANRCSLGACRCRTERMGRCKTSGKATLVTASNCAVHLHRRAQCCARMLVRCTRLSIPDATRMCTRYKNIQTTAVSWLQRKPWRCGGAWAMDMHLGLIHRWRWSSEPYVPVCTSVGRKLSELSAADLPQEKTSGPRRRKYVLWLNLWLARQSGFIYHLRQACFTLQISRLPEPAKRL